MSTTVGRNSLIMACGTAASRVTGQIRTIFLVGALGTTGIAANAYQAGAQIPQVIFNLLSTGVFNAVLVPQIVRTLKQKDADERLSKLITLSIALLLAITLLMASGTPLLTMLYLDSSWTPAQRALANAFTLWCMPQILFYGLYTVLGQILAAKGRFATYAWSSVGANVISCIGFGAFIMLFGNAGRQPMSFWTSGKIALTAGAWTAGVAFQALVLFIPLLRCGIHYRPRWGLHGLGLRSMGQVAVWSIAMVLLNQLMGIVNSRVNTGAPTAGGDLYGIAGNASYQYAYTIYVLPYSIIAVSITTAVFPRMSRAISEHRIGDARADLSSSLRSTGLAMFFFTAVMIAMPVPLVKALIPSTNVHGAILISGPLIGLLVGLVPTSAFLLVQRAFYAYEDGRSPFLFAAADNAVQLLLLLTSLRFAPPKYWTLMVALSLSLSYIITFPWVFWLLRRRFGGRIDGKRIIIMHVKALIAGAAACACGLFLNPLATHLVGAKVSSVNGHMSWWQSIVICAILTIVVTAVYAGLLWLMRMEEFSSLIVTMKARLLRRTSTATSVSTPAESEAEEAQAQNAEVEEGTTAIAENDNHYDNHSLGDDGTSENDGSAERAAETVTDLERPVQDHPRGIPSDNLPPSFAPTVNRKGQRPSIKSVVLPNVAANAAGATAGIAAGNNAQPRIPTILPTPHHSTRQAASIAAAQPTIPTARMSASPLSQRMTAEHGETTTMKPQLGDTVIGRYTLVSSLRESDGLSAWIANDRMLAQSCQLFIITDTSVLPQINEAASTLALANSRYCTPVLQLQHVGDAAVVITEPDSGLALAEYMQRSSSSFLSYDAIRSIVGQCTQAVQELLDTGLTHTALSTDTIRVSVNGVQFADTPVAAALADICSGIDGDVMSYEQMATRQLAALLYALLTKTPSGANTTFDLNMLPADVPTEFRVICKRGLALHTEDGEIIVPMATLAELSALLGAWEPFGNLSDRDIILPSVSGSASISMVALRDTSDDKIVELPDGLVTSTKLPELSISEAGLAAGAEARFVNEQRLAQQAFLAQLPGDPPSADQPVIPEAELFEPDTAEPSKTLASLQSKVGQLMGSLRKDGEPESPVTTSTAEETAIEQPMPVYAPLPASFPPAAKPRRSATGATQAQSSNGVNVPANAAGASAVAGGTGKPRTIGATGEIQSIVANMPNVPLPEENDNERTRAGSIPPLPQSGEAQVSEGKQTVAGSHPTTRAAQPIATNAMPQPRAHMSESLAALAARSAKAAASGDAVMPPSFAVSASAPGANGAAIPGSSKSRTRMTAPISRDALRNMSGGRPAAAPGANVPGVQTPAQRAQSDAFDPTVTVPLLGTDGTSVDQLPPMAQIMPPSFAPQQVHDVNAANVGRNIEEDLPDQPLWGQLKIKVIAIVVALVLLVVGLVAAWFILNGDNHGGGSDNQDWPNKTDIDNVPFGNSTTQNSTSKNSTSKNSAAQSDIVYIRVL